MPELAYREEPLERHVEQFLAQCEEPDLYRAVHEDMRARLSRLHGFLGSGSAA